MSENLNKVYGEIISFIKSSGFLIFPTVSDLVDQGFLTIIWDNENSDWRSFLEIAKTEGVQTIFIGAFKGEEENHAEDIGLLQVSWIKDGVAYIFEKRAEWWETEIEEETSEETLDELQNKDEAQLADELLEFISKDFPNLEVDRAILLNYFKMFWDQKGIEKWGLEPKLLAKIEKAELLVKQKLKQQQLNKEKELLSNLVEECVNWAEKNNFRRVTKSNIDSFLVEKEIKLTKTSKDILYSKVNAKLAALYLEKLRN